MIYTVTLSPSIDYVLKVDPIKPGAINRSEDEILRPGGKGINVSLTLAALGRRSVATGFLGGFVGDFIEKAITDSKIKTDFVRIEGNSRINVKILAKEETAINSVGPRFDEDNINELIKKLDRLWPNDYLVLSGGVPKYFPVGRLYEMIDLAHKKGAKVVLDSSGPWVLEAVKHGIFLLKPNATELASFFEKEEVTEEEIPGLIDQLLDMGAENVILSKGDKGATLYTKGKSYSQDTIVGSPVDTVGAGDALVAGFLHEYIHSKNKKKALSYGVACGTAAAFVSGMPSKENIDLMLTIMGLDNLRR